MLWAELLRLWRDRAVLLTIFGGVLCYAVLYPQPYLNDRTAELPLAVIDRDRSASSRQLLRWIDASPDVRLAFSVSQLAEVRARLELGQVRGFIDIPSGFERDMARGASPVVALAGDANYFLVYGASMEAMASAVLRMGAQVQMQGALSSERYGPWATSAVQPFRLNLQPLYNPSLGYLGYVIPAVFVLILQQTLLLAAGLAGAGRGADGSALRSSANRALALGLPYLPLALFYFGFCFAAYEVERHARPEALAVLILVFLLAIACMGAAFGAWLPQRRLSAPLVMLSSLPMIFSAGFIWPRFLIPAPLRWLSDLAPSTPAIQAFLSLNQLGADFMVIVPFLIHLLALAAGFLALAWLGLKRRKSGRTPASIASC